MPPPKTFTVKVPLLKVGCILGEAPLYDLKTQVLHFVNICENKVFHLDTRTLALSVETFDESTTCLPLRNHGEGLACMTASGFAVLDGGSRLHHLCKPLPEHHAPYVRFNDGACDSNGRFFAGSIHSKDQGIPGQLWMYDPVTAECKVVDERPFTHPRYFTDSLTNLIYAYDFDDGKLSNRRVVVDAIARGWGGSRIVRFSPQGNIDAEIHFPTVLNVTACCFGGLNDDQLYVTTAHYGAIGGDSSLQEKYPDSGHLFVGGQWRYPFGG
ncbi:regucalcin [Imleria badia]|nr:regucalcin [Imleria badia]